MSKKKLSSFKATYTEFLRNVYVVYRSNVIPLEADVEKMLTGAIAAAVKATISGVQAAKKLDDVDRRIMTNLLKALENRAKQELAENPQKFYLRMMEAAGV